MTAPLTRRELWRVHQLFKSIYDRHPCGCCWHVVLDDGNNEDEHVRFCIEWAAEEHPEHEDCREIGPLLLRMSVEEREAISMETYRELEKEFG